MLRVEGQARAERSCLLGFHGPRLTLSDAAAALYVWIGFERWYAVSGAERSCVEEPCDFTPGRLLLWCVPVSWISVLDDGHASRVCWVGQSRIG